MRNITQHLRARFTEAAGARGLGCQKPAGLGASGGVPDLGRWLAGADAVQLPLLSSSLMFLIVFLLLSRVAALVDVGVVVIVVELVVVDSNSNRSAQVKEDARFYLERYS